MNTDIAYKGLKYVIVWVVIYFAVKYTASEELSEIDIALIATVLTLLLCILETMYSNGCGNQENMVTNTGRSQDVNFNAGMSAGACNIDTMSNMSNMSSNSSSCSNPVSVLSSGVPASNIPDTVANMLNQDNLMTNTDSMDSSMSTPSVSIPSVSMSSMPSSESSESSESSKSSESSESQSLPHSSGLGTPTVNQNPNNNYDYSLPSENNGKPIDHLFVDRDYLGQEVIFDKNGFGGTNIQTVTNTLNSIDGNTAIPSILYF